MSTLLALHDDRHACLCRGWRILVALLRTTAKICRTPLQGKDRSMPCKISAAGNFLSGKNIMCKTSKTNSAACLVT